MVLSFADALRVVFIVYALFWVVVLAVLFFAIGVLMRRRERTLAERRHGEGGAGH